MLEKRERKDTCNVRSHAIFSLVQERNFAKDISGEERKKKRIIQLLKYKTVIFVSCDVELFNRDKYYEGLHKN